MLVVYWMNSYPRILKGDGEQAEQFEHSELVEYQIHTIHVKYLKITYSMSCFRFSWYTGKTTP